MPRTCKGILKLKIVLHATNFIQTTLTHLQRYDQLSKRKVKFGYKKIEHTLVKSCWVLCCYILLDVAEVSGDYYKPENGS